MMWLRLVRQPESWEGFDPWEALAIAIMMRAHRDLVKGARMARVIIEGATGQKRKRAIRVLRGRDAYSAALFFLKSPIWHYFLANFGHQQSPRELISDVGDVLEAYEVLEDEVSAKEDHTA